MNRPISLVRAGAALALAVTSIMLTLAASVTPSDARGQRQFKTPDEAAAALVAAVRADDERLMLSVLGRDGAHVISSGDATEDTSKRREFVAAYDAKHEVEMSGEARAILNIGPKDFPFPIPLVREKGAWRFDTAAGRAEILSRRIGRNELSAMQACLAYYDAQNEYVEKDRTGANIRAFAQRIASQPGKKDGLYWPVAPGGDESPLGELVADAAADGYALGKQRAPYHGYYYKVLTRQTAAASGGELDYVVGGHMIGGFALVAYPSSYGVSGIMTFMISHTGVVYQKDLGRRTAQIAERMNAFDPGQGWEVVRVTAPPPSDD
jgi:hypothetical protein